MGKKLTNENQGPSRHGTPHKALPQPQDHEILMENTQQVVNNTSDIISKGPSSISKKNTSQTFKLRKSRVYNPDDRFSNGHIKRYFLFPFYYSTLFPYLKISWKVWKPNSVFIKMAQFLSNVPGLTNKDPIQCKSFDQRMKEQNYLSAPEGFKRDLLETALFYLKDTKLDKEEKEVVQRYIRKMNARSQYMNFLQKEAIMDEESEEESEEIKKENDVFIPYQKKEQTSINSPNEEKELIFNQFLDIQK